MVSRELLEEFKIIYKEQFNVSITDEEATAMTTDLVNLMKVLLKPSSNPQTTNDIEEDEEERRTDESIPILKP